ncbi:hypothetical protein WR25_12334 [Diploscapter pachys]|uniref:Methyltransferase FkbM domain-containing protein n=1 Tax=Diploscapter pachys TaxID=2018661 RepID=A0A2A2LBM9_9BILA|nr:hypothetical protein WR25_12334 [Diploscapter pachys]
MRCKVYGYDKEADTISNGVYRSINGLSRGKTIGVVTNEDTNTISLEDLMKLEGVGSIEILKIDIEGAEYEVVIPFLERNSVCQILIEIHINEKSENYDKVKDLLIQIAKLDYFLFNFEINPLSPFTATEFSLIHRSCFQRYGAVEIARYLNV